jgi:endonuclease/exonuclease/phosphatase (EEP) superfamily protein YafD
MLIKHRTDKSDLVVIKTHMPTSVYKDEDVEDVYEQLEEEMENVKESDNLIFLGDCNAVVGEGHEGDSRKIWIRS